MSFFDIFNKLKEPSTKTALITIGLLSGVAFPIAEGYEAVMLVMTGAVQLYELIRKEKID